MTTYSRESSYLLSTMGETARKIMDDHGAFMAGGAVTSVFSSAKINDFDLFFPNEGEMKKAISTITPGDKSVDTDSALSVILDGHRVQFIKCVFGTPEEVIGKFDFTICQAAFDLKNGFTFGGEFFAHLAQRRLVFNISAEYPICSLYRSRKFIKRGFSFSGIEAIKLGLRIQALDLSTYADLRKQLMGIDTLFLKELTDSLKGEDEKRYDLNEFLTTLDKWLEKLDAITSTDD